MERVAVVASTLRQYELALQRLRLPISRARLAVAAVNLEGLSAAEVVVVSPCRARGIPGVTRYWEAVREVERMERRDGVRARWVQA